MMYTPNPYGLPTATNRFYVVMVNVNPGLTISDVQSALTPQLQWYRIANNVWVVYTNLGKDWLHTRLSSLATPSGALFISRLDATEHQGLMPQPFWDWLNARIAMERLGL
jgi:hypothetical protein